MELDELETWALRPRERWWDARLKGGSGAARARSPRKASHKLSDAKALVSEWHRRVARGLNGDPCGHYLSAEIAELTAKADSTLKRTIRTMFDVLIEQGSCILTSRTAVRALLHGLVELGPWACQPEDLKFVDAAVESDDAGSLHTNGRTVPAGWDHADAPRWLPVKSPWTPQGQAIVLIRQLRLQYEVPAFMLRGFLEVDDWKEAAVARRMAMCVGNGQSLRKIPDLPVPLTRAGAHVAQEAPRWLAVGPAMRWAQFVAAGVPEKLALYVAAEYYRPFGIGGREELYGRLANWFSLRASEFRFGWVSQVLSEAFELDREARAYGTRLDLSVCTPRGLLRRAEARAARRRLASQPNFWPSCGIPSLLRPSGLTATEPFAEIVELTTWQELQDEGKAMNHCVGGYARDCFEKHSAIYSVRCGDNESSVERLATVEVCLEKKEIVQCKGKGNRRPSTEVIDLVVAWAEKVGLNARSTLWWRVQNWEWAR